MYSSMTDTRDGAGAYLAGYATYNFENTRIEGATGLYAKSGEMHLVDCEVIGTGEKVTPIYSNQGYWPNGSALVLDSAFGGYVRPLNVLVDGGIYTSSNAYAIEEISTHPVGEVVEDYVTYDVINNPVLTDGVE